MPLATSRNRPQVHLRIFALWIAVTFFLPSRMAYSNPNLTILSEANLVIILIDSAASLPTKCSTPEYSPSVFSRMITRSIFSYLPPSIKLLAGLTPAYKSSLCLKVTFIDRKPLPTGVVIGPFKPTLFLLSEQIIGSTSGDSSFQETSSHSIPAPAASNIWQTASTISGPIPSPLTNVIFIFMDYGKRSDISWRIEAVADAAISSILSNFEKQAQGLSGENSIRNLLKNSGFSL